MNDVEVHEYGDTNLENALVITGFPTVGLVGTIAGKFVVESLGLQVTASFLSDYFPPLSVISNREPYPMVRAYAGEKKCGPNGTCEQLITILSELPLNPVALRPLANTVLDWCAQHHCKIIVCMEGFNIGGAVEEVPLIGVGSTENARAILKKYAIEEMQEGMVSGLSGILLYEGKKRGFDVACMLAGTHTDFPDAKAAARVLEVVNRMLPEIEIDPEPLYKQAEEIEKQIKTQMEKAKPTPSAYAESPMMYG